MICLNNFIFIEKLPSLGKTNLLEYYLPLDDISVSKLLSQDIEKRKITEDDKYLLQHLTINK